MCESQTVHKIQPINIKYLLNLQCLEKWLITNMLKHTRNTNNSGIRFSRFTMNNVAQKLKNAGHTILLSTSYQKC